MGKFGQTAAMAAEFLAADDQLSPREAWRRAAARVFVDSESSRKKSCPRDAFLGLCEAGVVMGVTAGSYTNSIKNKEYIVRALQAVRRDPLLLDDQGSLWRLAVEESGKAHNQQLDVLRGLWESGRLRTETGERS